MQGNSSERTDPLNDFVIAGHQPEAVYIYRARDGSTVGAVARYAPGTRERDRKSFLQYRHTNGRFRAGLQGMRLPLYRLPEVLAAIQRRECVFICEGEKCVEALLQAGIPAATTNPGGGGKWGEEYSEALKGANVVLVPDNDAPGIRHVRQVAIGLRGLASSVKVLELPGLPPKGDVVDWLARGQSADELRRLVEEAAPWTPPADVADGKGPIPFAVNSSPAPFPIETALPESLARIASEVARVVRVDVAAPGALISAALSTAVGNAWVVRVSATHVEGALARFVIWIADPGERKSATFRRIVEPLDKWTADRKPDYQEKKKRAELFLMAWEKQKKLAAAEAARMGTAEDQVSLLGQALKNQPGHLRPPCPPVLYLANGTTEFLARQLDVMKGGFGVLSPDARHVADIVLGRYRRDAKSDPSLYLLAHAGDVIDRGRIGLQGDGELRSISHPSLALGICLQPDKLDELAGRKDLHSSGFLARCNVVFPRSRIGERIENGDELPMDSTVQEMWTRILWRLADDRFRRIERANGCLDPVELVLDPEAQELRRRFQNELEERQRAGQDLEEVRAFASKAAGEAARLAALFHLADCALNGDLSDGVSLTIPASTWKTAETYQRWQLTETLRCLRYAGERAIDRKARSILDWTRQDPERRRVVSARALQQARKVDRAAEAYEVMERLVEMGWVTILRPEGERTSQRWQFCPQTFLS